MLPYVLVYFWAWQRGWQTDQAALVFRGLHGLNLVLFILVCHRIFGTPAIRRVPFFGCLFALFLLPGALFEYGTDMWFQFERNFAFVDAPTLADSMRPDRFGFFFGYTFFGWVEPTGRRFAMGLYGAGTSTLLCYQFFRLAKSLGFRELTARVAVLAVVLLTGTAQLSFFRDYAISSTLIAHTAYIALLGILIEAVREKKWRPLILAPAAFLVMLANHPQTVLFLLVAIPALLAAGLAHHRPAWKSSLLKWGLALLLLGAGAGALFLQVVRPHLSATSQAALAHLSPWGSYPLWNPDTHVFVTFSLTGLLAVVWALLRWRKHPYVCTLTLAPVYFLLFPPSQIPFTLFLGHYDLSVDTLLGAPHRIAFAFPIAFVVPLALREAFLRGGMGRQWVPATTAFALILLALPAAPPFFGKFWNLIHQSDALDRAYFPLAAEWFAQHPDRPDSSGLRTDRVSALGIFLATRNHGAETNVSKAGIQEIWPTQDLGQSLPDGMVEFWKARRTGFLFVDPDADLRPRISPFGLVYPSVPPGESVRHLSANQHFARRHLRELRLAGWKTTHVPPFFLLLEPPAEGEGP